MRFLKKPLMILMLLTIVVVVVFLMKDTFTQASPLSKEEINSQLAAIFDSDVESLTLHGDIYEATLFKEGAEYTVQAHAESGKVLSLEKTKDTPLAEKPEENGQTHTEEADPPETDEEKEASETKVEDEEKEKPDHPEEPEEPDKREKSEEPDESEDPPEKEPTTLISEEEAASIALAELPEGMIGEVDDIDFEKTNEGGYYLVEIDIDTEEEEDEVVYQIHAISGKVMSVTWDD